MTSPRVVVLGQLLFLVTQALLQHASAAAAVKASMGAGRRSLLRASKNEACQALKGAVACGTDTGCTYMAAVKDSRGRVRKPHACVALPATCVAASFDSRACYADNVAGTVCRYDGGICTEVRFCHRASLSRNLCERASASGVEGGCSWLTTMIGRGRNRRRVSRCAATPVTCSEAGTDAALCRIADMNCAMRDGACAMVATCADADSLQACSKVGVIKANQIAGHQSTECVWFTRRVVRGVVVQKARCEVTPQTCEEASSRGLCGVVAENCDWGIPPLLDSGEDLPTLPPSSDDESEYEVPLSVAPPEDTCYLVDTCVGATTRALCDGVVSESCLWVAAKKNSRGRVIQAAQCANVPSTCEAATLPESCDAVASQSGLNCAWAGESCVNVETCEIATSASTCQKVAKVSCSWKLPVRRSGAVVREGSCAAQCKPSTYKRCVGNGVCNDKNRQGTNKCANALTGCSDLGGYKWRHCDDAA